MPASYKYVVLIDLLQLRLTRCGATPLSPPTSDAEDLFLVIHNDGDLSPYAVHTRAPSIR